MNIHRFDEAQRRAWVEARRHRVKTVKQICNEAGISRATLYNWIAEFPDAGEAENEGPKARAVRAAALEAVPLPDTGAAAYRMLLTALGKVDEGGTVARKMAGVLIKRYNLSVARACEIVGIDESAYGYKPRKPEEADDIVREELRRLLTEDPRRGLLQLYEIVQQTHPKWTLKQVKRLYREDRLYLLRRRPKRKKDAAPETTSAPGTTIAETPAASPRRHRPGATWSFGMTAFAGGWLLYLLDAEDAAPLNALATEDLPADEDLLAFLQSAVSDNGAPRKLRLPAIPPFNSRAVSRWAWEGKVAIVSLSMGKEENKLEAEVAEAVVRQGIALGADESLEEIERAVEEWLAG